jgi:Na+-transporting methylmalonyl-CoA/oxaloacetate decarboxylase gamma subunit
MSADAHGGGGNSGVGFFVVLILVLAVAWFFAQVQKQRTSEQPSAQETVRSAAEEGVPTVAPKHTKRAVPPPEDHGVTYYLDEEGNILDVVRF